jgi:hypothetical protein
MRRTRLATITVCTIGPVLWHGPALAQQSPGGDAPGGGTSSGAAAGGTSTSVAPGGTTTIVVQPPTQSQTSTSTGFYPPFGGTPHGVDLDKGLSSSSREAGESKFDLRGSGGTRTVHGSSGSSFVLSGQSVTVPMYHFVRRGDTLWDLCDRFYGNPWSWPRVWSYNPQVENPHWIYPGDRLRMREGDDTKAARTLEGSGVVLRKAVVPAGTVFLRDKGYVDDERRDVWGSLVGSADDQMLLSEGNEAYLEIKGDRDIRIGQELTLFTPMRKPDAGSARGYVVEIKGTARVLAWDPATHIARAKITESLDIVERGALVGPLGRRFDIVPPVANTREVWGKVAATLDTRAIVGQHQVVFVDKGEEEGLRPGNRLFVIARGDRWRKTLVYGKSMAAHRAHYEIERAEVEEAPDTTHGRTFPEERVGEMRVLRTRAHSATCVVTLTDFELQAGDTFVARRGY